MSDADLDAQAKFLGALLPTIIRTLPDLIGAFRRRDEPTLSGDAVGGSRQVAYAYR